MLKISVIVPIYNVESYVETCINSIINQTYSNLEIVLVDDGSQDSSGQICDRFSELDSRIKVIHTKNRGLSAARNEGIRNSSGEYIMFVDGDDFININAVQDIIQIIREQEGVDIVVGKMIEYYNDRKKVVENFRFIQDKFNKKSGVEVLRYFFEEIPVIMWSACRSAYKRQLLVDNEFYFTEGITSEDLDLVPRIYMYADKVASYDIPFYYYRQLRPNSIINTVNPKKFSDIILIINKYILELQDNSYSEKFKRSFLKQLANIYARYIVILGSIPKSKRKEIVDEMKTMKHILVYTKGFRGKCITVFVNTFGFEFTFTLYAFLKSMKNFIIRDILGIG